MNAQVTYLERIRQTFYFAPSGTALVTVYTVQSVGVRRSFIDSINISAGNTGASFDVLINDGTNDFYLAFGRVVDANKGFKDDFGQPVLLPGYSIKVKSSLANELDFAITIIEDVA